MHEQLDMDKLLSLQMFLMLPPLKDIPNYSKINDDGDDDDDDDYNVNFTFNSIQSLGLSITTSNIFLTCTNLL